MSESKYRKHFIPLESNPEVFTWLVHKLGVSETLSFVDIWALDSTEHVPRPAVALVLVFPTSADYEQRRSAEDSGLQEHIAIRKDGDGIIWLPQTINNACGLYAIFHAVCNSDARRSIRTSSPSGKPCQSAVFSIKNKQNVNVHQAPDPSWPIS